MLLVWQVVGAGYGIGVDEVDKASPDVNTLEDLETLDRLLDADPLTGTIT